MPVENSTYYNNFNSTISIVSSQYHRDHRLLPPITATRYDHQPAATMQMKPDAQPASTIAGHPTASFPAIGSTAVPGALPRPVLSGWNRVAAKTYTPQTAIVLHGNRAARATQSDSVDRNVSASPSNSTPAAEERAESDDGFVKVAGKPAKDGRVKFTIRPDIQVSPGDGAAASRQHHHSTRKTYPTHHVVGVDFNEGDIIYHPYTIETTTVPKLKEGEHSFQSGDGTWHIRKPRHWLVVEIHVRHWVEVPLRTYGKKCLKGMSPARVNEHVGLQPKNVADEWYAPPNGHPPLKIRYMRRKRWNFNPLTVVAFAEPYSRMFDDIPFEIVGSVERESLVALKNLRNTWRGREAWGSSGEQRG